MKITRRQGVTIESEFSEFDSCSIREQAGLNQKFAKLARDDDGSFMNLAREI